MAMSAGSVTVTRNADGSPNIAGTGLAYDLAHGVVPALVTFYQSWPSAGSPTVVVPLPAVGDATPSPFSADFKCTQGFLDAYTGFLDQLYASEALRANIYATKIVAHIQANATASLDNVKATVTTEVLGKTPNPNNANTDIVPPGSGSPRKIPVSYNGDGTLTIPIT